MTGLVKVIKNLPFVYIHPSIISWTTLIHTFATFLFLFGFVRLHIAALILKVNRPLVRPIFTGNVDLDYVRHRHTIWYDMLVKKLPPEETKTEEPEASETVTVLAALPSTVEVPAKATAAEPPAFESAKAAPAKSGEGNNQ